MAFDCGITPLHGIHFVEEDVESEERQNPNNQAFSVEAAIEDLFIASNVGQISKGDIDPKLVLQCFGRELDKEDLWDFTVMVEGKQFKCHRFVLSACSDFFQRLLRSDMTEKNSGKATLEGMSSEAFKLILDVIYRGQNILTKENITLVWQAANHLQISFLIDACEDFAITNMSSEDILPIHQMANFLDSKKVLSATREMMVEKFSDILHHDLFLQLPFNDFFEVLKKYMGQGEESENTHQYSELRRTTIDEPVSHMPGPRPVTYGQPVNYMPRPIPVTYGQPVNYMPGPTPVTYGQPVNYMPGPIPVTYGRPLSFKSGQKMKNRGLKHARQFGANCFQTDNDTAINASMFWTTGNPEYRVNISETGFIAGATSPTFRINTKGRAKFLKALLEAAGIFDATTDCIKRLMQDEIVMKNKEARDLVLTVSMQRMS